MANNPANENQPTLDDIVVGGFTDARDMLFRFFETDNINLLADYYKVLNALRVLQGPTLNDVGMPILTRMFAEIKADPKTDEGRRRGLQFVDCIALAIEDAVNMMMQAAQHQAQMKEALARGRANQKVLGV